MSSQPASPLPPPLPTGTNGNFGPEVWTIENTPLAQNGEFISRCSRAGTERLMPRRAKL